MISNNIDPQKLSPFVQVQFKNKCLVDTGTNKSVISEKFLGH